MENPSLQKKLIDKQIINHRMAGFSKEYTTKRDKGFCSQLRVDSPEESSETIAQAKVNAVEQSLPANAGRLQL